MDLCILSYHHWKGQGGQTVHLCGAITTFMEEEISIPMTYQQGMIFMHTPECEMLHEAAEKAMQAKAAPKKPVDSPPPLAGPCFCLVTGSTKPTWL